MLNFAGLDASDFIPTAGVLRCTIRYPNNLEFHCSRAEACLAGLQLTRYCNTGRLARPQP